MHVSLFIIYEMTCIQNPKKKKKKKKINDMDCWVGKANPKDS
jgi:hypothetical protein